MTAALFTTSGSWLPLAVGSLLLLYATAKAVQQRNDPRRLILWGGLHDVGVICMALCAQVAAGLTGLWLFAIFQIAARLLAWCALARLSAPAESACACPFRNLLAAGPSLDELNGQGQARPWAGALFGLGLLAAVGGSPFLLPEARALLTVGLLETLPAGGFFCLMLMAAATTIFIWLYVVAVRHICLERPAGGKEVAGEKAVLFGTGLTPALFVLGLAVALLGVFRAPITDAIGGAFGLALPHSPVSPAFWCLYIGAFVTGAAFLMRVQVAPYIGTLFFACALAAVCVAEAAPLAQFFLVIIALIGLVVAVYSLSYIHDGRKGWYWFFLLLTFASLAGIVSTPDVMAMYGYWELMTFASYFLVVHEEKPAAYDAGLKYYVMCAGGALFMLPGLFLLKVFSLEPGLVFQLPAWLQMGLILCLAGFGVKAGLVPLHSWLPDAHPAAPSSVSAPLSGVITKMGIFGILSVIIIGVGRPESELPGMFGLSWFGTWLCGMGAATLIYGEIMALMQSDIKRMLAYSTMGQIGEIALVLGLGTWLATAGALWHVFNHAVMKDLLFLAAGALIMRAGSRNLADLRGLGHQMPWTVACMCVGLISIMGLPPFGAFYSKFLMIQAAVSAGHIWVAVLLLAGALVGAVYYGRILKTLVFEQRPADLPVAEEAPFTMRIAMLVLAAMSLVAGLAPQVLMPLVLPVASLAYEVPAQAPAILAAMSVNWPIYVIFPVFGAVLPALFCGKPRMAGWMSVGVLLVTALLVLIFGRDLDTLSFCFALIVPLVGAINMAYAVGYMSHSHSQWRFYCAFTCMCGGLVGMSASQYLLSFFLFWEIMSSWTLYMSIAHEGDPDSLREAFKYFLFNLFGAGFLFVGLAVLGPFTPFNTSLLSGILGGISPWAAWLGMALLAIGFVLKAAQLPFRIDWQMHPALAPTPVSGYISSVLLKSAIIGLVKLFMLLGGGFALAGLVSGLGESIITTVVMWIGGITIIMAAVQALRANGIKLVFIYSTVSQLGYMVLAVAAGGALGYAGGLLHLINHVFFKDLLFLICGAVMFATHADTLDDLGGIGRKMPFTLLMFAIAGLSLVGVPPTSGFSSKWLIYHALMQADQPFLALLSLVGSVITLAYIAKFMHAAFLGQPGPHLDKVTEAPLVMRVPMGILALGCVVTGIFPGLPLMHINNILAQYGASPLNVGISGILSGPGTWNATGMFIMMALAFAGGTWFVRRFTRLREIDVHTCGLPTETATSRMTPASIYGDLVRMLGGDSAPKENRS
ncbi:MULTISPECIES: proton-conducting transporter membrane subunit [unclassified Desulfovibrio]|uniref:complex I subunit 5 family protein n=1 Tax=unclassified Desulfovibrio TaxID=2593640 RepID=UPI0013EE0811|nr:MULTISPECIES: proton-conducting transporter membrane subunit [unclassified Desulfovibrio]